MELLYYNPLQPYLSWWGIFWSTFFLIISGLRTWFKWDTSTFLTYCEPLRPKRSAVPYNLPSLSSDINIPIFLALYFGYKIIKKTKIRKWSEMDFVTGIPTPEETEIPEVPPNNIWEKTVSFVF